MTPLQKVHAALLGQNWLLWNYHWQAMPYGDHLLFERLYSARGGEIDRMAELIIPLQGQLDVVATWLAAAEFIKAIESSQGSLRDKAAQSIQGVLSRIKEAEAAFPNNQYKLAVSNALSGIADSQMEALYLTKGGR